MSYKEGVIFLRILGEDGSYIVMTATAGEDTGGITAFFNQQDLIKAALLVSEHLNSPSIVKNDFNNREYVELCECEYLSDAYKAAEMLFRFLKNIGAND